MKRFKPLIDKLFWFITVPTLFSLVCVTVLCAANKTVLLLAILMDLTVIYLIVSPLFGYVELREKTVLIKFGFILKREIPYSSVRGAVKDRGIWSESMISLKNAMEHINIKYNSFDVVTVSVTDNDGFIEELKGKIK